MGQHLYRGTRSLEGGTRVTVDGLALPRRDDLSHSTARFDWGYAGPEGPTQLSWAILAHHFGDDRAALRFCAHFLRSAVAHLDGMEWTLTTGEVAAHVSSRR